MACPIPPTLTNEALIQLHERYLKQGLHPDELKAIVFPVHQRRIRRRTVVIVLYTSVLTLLISILYTCNILNFILEIRCVVPNNYFIWEATRPLSDCLFCSNLTQPIELHNVTKKEFEVYAYSSQPLVVRGAFLHWPAMKMFSWEFFKELYAKIDGSYDRLNGECQFLHFKSDFISLKDVFSMSSARVKNRLGEKSWYVGWRNCHPEVIKEMRKFYPKPHFLPDDAEIHHEDYVFMGYDDGARMHLDFIDRLMWQAQLRGSKIWKLLPPPECQSVCAPIQFQVQPGDGVLVDTRIWYHATSIPNGEFSLSIQSEYG